MARDHADDGSTRMMIDAAKGLGVVAGGVAADGAREALKATAAKAVGGLGAAKAGAVIGAGAGAGKAAGAALVAAKAAPLAVAAATPLATVLLPIAAAVTAGYLVRRALRRPG
ncbi:MAG: hypothetical protein AAF698_09240 [Pseudomonadota bacterium]